MPRSVDADRRVTSRLPFVTDTLCHNFLIVVNVLSRRRSRRMLIASMATISSRQSTLQRVIDSVSQQTRRPDLLLLYYSRTRWHLDDGLCTAPRVRADFPVKLCEVPNVGSARKYLSTLASHAGNDVHVVLVDDDRIWAPYVFDRLLSYAVSSGQLATTRGWTQSDDVNGTGEPVPRNVTVASSLSRARAVTVASSGWATLFHVRHVDNQLFDRRLHRAYSLRYSDEIFLSAMLRCRKLVVPLSKDFCETIKTERELWSHPKTISAKLKQFELIRS